MLINLGCHSLINFYQLDKTVDNVGFTGLYVKVMGGHAVYGVSPWPSLINCILPEKRTVTRGVPQQ